MKLLQSPPDGVFPAVNQSFSPTPEAQKAKTGRSLPAVRSSRTPSRQTTRTTPWPARTEQLCSGESLPSTAVSWCAHDRLSASLRGSLEAMVAAARCGRRSRSPEEHNPGVGDHVHCRTGTQLRQRWAARSKAQGCWRARTRNEAIWSRRTGRPGQ